MYPLPRGHDFLTDDASTDRLLNQMLAGEGDVHRCPFLCSMRQQANLDRTVPRWLQPRLAGQHTLRGAETKDDSDHFSVNVNVSQFKPEEITVTMGENNMLTIEGRAEERMDEHGFISRHFKRRYQLPKECDVDTVEPHLSHDGVLNVTARKPPKEHEKAKVRVIPIKNAPAHPKKTKKSTSVDEAKHGKEGKTEEGKRMDVDGV